MITIHDIARKLNKSRATSSRSYLACCPAHDDKNPSLALTEKDDKILVHCFAGCSQESVISALTHLGCWPKPKTNHDPCHIPLTSQELSHAKFFVAMSDSAPKGIQTKEELAKAATFRELIKLQNQ